MVASSLPSSRHLDQDGFALLPAFADPIEVSELRSATAARLGRSRDGACERPHNILVPLRWNDPIVRLLLDDQARVTAVREASCANDLRWISGYVSLKEPHTPPLWWHQDWWCWDHAVTFEPAAPQVALLLYLTDTTQTNGALRVLPGSHHRSGPIHALLPEAHSKQAGDLDPMHPALCDLASQETLSLRAGDAVLLDYRLLHGTHANRTTAQRDALLLTFAPSWRDLPRDIRAHLIDHPALPSRDETPMHGSWARRLLPSFDGARASLKLNRNAPAQFAIRS